MYRHIIVNAFYCGIVGVITNDKLYLRVPFKPNWLPIIQKWGCSMAHLIPNRLWSFHSIYGNIVLTDKFLFVVVIFNSKISANICLFIKMEIRAMQKNAMHMWWKKTERHTHACTNYYNALLYVPWRHIVAVMCEDMQQIRWRAFFSHTQSCQLWSIKKFICVWCAHTFVPSNYWYNAAI